jgi:hypothetical protein
VSKPLGQLCCACAVALLAFAAGCSSSTKKNQNASGIQFVNPSASPTIDSGQSITVSISAADSAKVTWTLEAGFGAAKGTLTNRSGSSATYTAPSGVTSETQVTIVATSGTDSAALPVFVMPAPQITGLLPPGPFACPASGSIVLPAPPATNAVGQTVATGSLTVAQTGGIPPYSWSVDSGSLPAGMTLQMDADPSKPPSLVGAPITVGCSTFTLTVTDAVGVSATSSPLNLVVIPPALKVNAPILHAALIDASNNGVSYAPAIMLAGGGTPPYVWSVPQSSPQTMFPPGLSMSSNGQITGMPSPDGLTTSGIGFGNYFPQLQVSDGQVPYPAVAQFNLSPAPDSSIQVIPQVAQCPAGFEGYLKAQGSYAFQLRGFDANGPVTISGNFVVDGAGTITGGNEDISRISGTQSGLTIQPGSTYTLDQANRGCVTLVNSAGTTTVFRIAMGGCSTGRDADGKDCLVPQGGGSYYFSSGHMVEFDDSTGAGTRASGIVRLQDSSTFQNSGINGMYAFGLSGWDVSKNRFAMAGSATASSGSWSSIAADTNDAGTLGTALTGGSGTFTIGVDGRGTGTLGVGSLSLNVVLYPVSSNEVLIATIGPPSASNPLLSGEAVSTTGAGSFTQQSLQNSHIFHIGGISPQGPDLSIGTLAFDGNGGFTGVEYENQAGTLSAVNLSGGYSMDGSSGRFGFSATGTQNVGLHPLVGYVIPLPSNLAFPACSTRAACISGFLLSTDSTAQAGVLEFQTPTIAPPPPFSVSFLQGTYVFGTDEALDSKTLQISGQASASPSGPVANVILDSSYGDPKYCLVPKATCAMLIPADQASLRYAVNTDGSGKFGGQTVSVTNGAATFYIDESPLNLHPVVVVVEH